MAIEITERFSGRSKSKGTQAWDARREFDITGLSAETEEAALDALANNTGGLGEAVQHNSTHPQAAQRPLLVSHRRAREVSPGLWRAFVRYTEPKHGGEHPEPSDDPLDEPPLIAWTDLNREVPYDGDKDGNPIVNSAREAYRQLPVDFVPDFRLTIWKNEPYFDVQLHKEIRLSVNETPLIVGGEQLADALEARLMVMQPDGRYLLTTPYVTVRYEWLIMHRVFAPSNVSPHAARKKDVGFRAAASVPNESSLGTDTQLVHLYEANEAGDPEKPVSTEVALNGNGQPIDSAYLLGQDNLSPASPGVPKGATLETRQDDDGNTVAAFLWYDPPNMTTVKHTERLSL